MPYRSNLTKQRLIVAKYILEALREVSEIHFGTGKLASRADEVLICTAIFIGQAEGRPLTVSKLADYIGMPRPTAIRKVASLVRRGIVTEVPETKRLLIESAELYSAEMVRASRETIKKIKAAARDVSKLDT